MEMKDFMIESLTNLLKDGETLQHPIFGLLKDNVSQYFAFFGLTENVLLIALVSGRTVTNTIRVPLDIKSVKIKQHPISKEYTVNIGFNEGSPCTFTAFLNVLKIDSQKTNLPAFLDCLKQKCPNDEPEQNIVGQEIRRQYFGVFTIFLASWVVAGFIMIIIAFLDYGRLTRKDIFEIVAIFFLIVTPFVILHVTNRLFYGKTVCIIADDGIYFENEYIPWDKLKEVKYNLELPSKYSARRKMLNPSKAIHYTTHVVLIFEGSSKIERKLYIPHFPIYGLKVIKKHAPSVKMDDDKKTMIFMILMPIVMALVASFAMLSI